MIRSSWEQRSPASKVHADASTAITLRPAAMVMQRTDVRALQEAGASRSRSFANLQGKLGTKGGLQESPAEQMEAGMRYAAHS